MKPISLTILLLVFTLTIGFSQSLIKHGFKDVLLDTPLNSFNDLTYKKDYDGYAIYERRNQSLKIGDIKLQNVEYLFYKNKLAEIRVYYSNHHCNSIINTFNDAYGVCSPAGGSVYYWANDKTYIGLSKPVSESPLYFDGKYIYPYFSISSRKVAIEKSDSKSKSRSEDI